MKTIIIEGQSISISDESFEALKKSLLKKDSRFVPEVGQEYYYTNSWGDKSFSTWSGRIADTFCLGQGNVFATEEEAKKHAEKLKAISDVVNYCYENDLVVDCDWENESQDRYVVYFDHDMSAYLYGDTGQDNDALILPYLVSEEACLQVIKEKKDQLDIIFGVK